MEINDIVYGKEKVEEKIKIGIDIDEVIVEFFQAYLELFNKKFNKNIKFEDWAKYEVWKFTDVSKEEALKLVDEFQSSNDFDNLEFVEGAREALHELKEKYDIHFVTSRPEKIKERTKRFLENFFGTFDFDLHFSGGVLEKSKTKGEIAKEFNLKYFIEDNYNYSLSCAEKGIKTFLMDKPWNQNVEEHENIVRVKNWKEILENLK